MAVSFTPAVIAILHDHMSREQIELAEATHHAELAVQLSADNYAVGFESARQVLIALSQVGPIREGDRSLCKNSLEKFLSKYPRFLNLGVVLRDGGLWASAVPFRDSVRFSEAAFFKRAMETKTFSVGEFGIDPATGQPTLNCGLPITQEGGPVDRILFASLDLRFLSSLARTPPGLTTDVPLLVDGGGTVLSSGKREEVGSKVSLPTGFPAPSAVVSFQIRDRLYAAAPVRTNPPSSVFAYSNTSVDDLFHVARLRLYQNLGWLVFSLLVAAALCGRVGGFFITRHVERILKTTALLSAGDLTARTGVGGESGELADLARAVDGMAANLQQRNTELETSRLGLEREVEVRTRELAEINKQLEAFSFSISHDLRAPLRAIDGFSQILLNEHASSLLPEGRRVLELVVKNSKHMAQLIEDLLAFSKLGRQEVVGSDLNMGEIAREVYQDLTTPPGPRKIDFTVAPLPNARGDSAMIRQVWVNLIENAIKFTSHTERATILVGGHKNGDENTYFVKDNGAGFDPRFAGKLFQVFQRLHGSSQFDGTGVGLAIVNRIVQKHGGRVWAESRPGEGAQFFFTLPGVPGRSAP